MCLCWRAVYVCYKTYGAFFFQNKSSLKKRTKAKTKESDLHVVSNVPASSLTSCDRCGFADVHFGSEPWVPHWCVVHEDCLYVYKTQTSDSTVNTIVLPGYNVQIIRSLAKKPYVVQMSHLGMSPVLLAFSDEVDLNNWLVFLEKGSRAESHKERNKAVRILSSDSIKTIASKPCKAKKGPLKADHNIRAKVIAHEVSICIVCFITLELPFSYCDMCSTNRKTLAISVPPRSVKTGPGLA